jgi:2-C-methyl-D-erythritol 4-phosphate cytidylyltransferase
MSRNLPPSSVPAADVTALILGAGMGLRMGMGPKAFLTYSGNTLLERAAAAVAPFASEIVVGVRDEDVPKARELFAGQSHKIVVGGATRQETVSRLLRHATRPIVLLHEVARPFVPPDAFERILLAAAEAGAASLYLPLEPRDSIALNDGGDLGDILPRSRVVTLQTPHAYRREVLLQADEQAIAKGWKEDGTAAMVKRAGFAVRLVPGSPDNVKLTYASDLSAIQRPPAGNVG